MRSVLTTRFYLKRTDELNVFTSQVTPRFFYASRKVIKHTEFYGHSTTSSNYIFPQNGFSAECENKVRRANIQLGLAVQKLKLQEAVFLLI